MKIDDFVKNVNTIAISGHVKPDGDSIGSVLALYNYLKLNYPDIKADMFLENPSDKFAYLKNFDRIICNAEGETAGSRIDGLENDESVVLEESYDLMICLDCSTKERLGIGEKHFDKAKHTICLDHHVSNPEYADENYVYGDLSSACEVLYNYLDHKKLNKDVAECIYTGMVTDTGIFKYSATSPSTMRAAADLMEFGLDTNTIIDECFHSKQYNENRILGYGIMSSKLAYEGQVIYSYVTKEDMDRFGVTTSELDSIVPNLRQTKGVRCAIFMYQTGEYDYKVSFRSSDDFDVNAIASVFGGGGHIRAAGCSVRGYLDTCLEAILLEVGKAL